MKELFRDTAFGHLVRLVTRGKYLQFAEEADPSVWTRYIDEKKSGYLAHHGTTEEPQDGTEISGLGGVRTREDQYGLEAPPHRRDPTRTPSNGSSRTRVADEHEPVNHVSGVKVDPEKGRDVHVVSWYGPNDPGEQYCYPAKRMTMVLTSVQKTLRTGRLARNSSLHFKSAS